MNDCLIIKEKKTITVERKIEITTLRYINPRQSLSHIKCGTCQKPIGKDRPIALVWADNSSWRVCNSCIQHIEKVDLLNCPECQVFFPSVEDETFWWGGSIHPDTENCRCPNCGTDTTSGYTFADFDHTNK